VIDLLGIHADVAAALGGVVVEVLRHGEITPSLIAQWADLERRSAMSNAYLSPHFILAAMRCLPAQGDPLFLAAWRRDGATSLLVGMGVFAESPAHKRFPFQHLAAYRCQHSYLTGVLMDRDYEDLVARAYFGYFGAPGVPWHGVEFVHRTVGGALDRLLAATDNVVPLRWYEYERSQRAILIPRMCGEEYLAATLSAHRLKKLRGQQRKLAEQGKLEWRLLVADEVSPATIEHFLALEDNGWRHERGTSLRSSPGHAAFFREMIEAFRRDRRVFFTELLVDGKVLASTSNLISGRAGFAFKIGWDPDYSKFSPGILNEVELVRCAHNRLSQLDYIDSGAVEDSFIDSLWGGHTTLTSGVLVTSRLARSLLPAISWLRTAKRYFRRERHSAMQ